jgi:hypothetical protein
MASERASSALGESANFEAKPCHCGFEIERNQKLVLNDAVLLLNYSE